MHELGEIGRVSTERVVSKIGERIAGHKGSPAAPIGMFDSGVGGLTVLSEVMRQLPHEDVVYFADTARVPYGGRPVQEILKINHELVNFLLNQGCKLIIMACGTSSSIAYNIVTREYKVPIIGLVGPGARSAVVATKNGKIGLIATVGTVESGAFQKEIRELREDAGVFAQACPMFVPLIEGGFMESGETKKVAAEYLKPLMDSGIDTLILGCTHYPHLRKVIQDITGPQVTLVDPAAEAVAAAREILRKKGLLSPMTGPAGYTYFVSGQVPQFDELASKLLGGKAVSGKKARIVAKGGSIE